MVTYLRRLTQSTHVRVWDGGITVGYCSVLIVSLATNITGYYLYLYVLFTNKMNNCNYVSTSRNTLLMQYMFYFNSERSKVKNCFVSDSSRCPKWKSCWKPRSRDSLTGTKQTVTTHDSFRGLWVSI